MYEIKILESTLVSPSQETPRDNIWLSNLELAWNTTHAPVLHFYRHNGSKDFFSIEIIKEALAKALVLFYPFAGRRGYDKDGRLEVQCAGEGVLLVVARIDVSIDEFIDEFVPSDDMARLFVPSLENYAKVDPSIMCIYQLTYFKCGSVCLGTGHHHVLVDGRSGFAFTKAWSRLARGDPLDTIPRPLFDHSTLRARVPPHVPYSHPEYTPIPPQPNSNSVVSVLTLTKSQLNSLKTQPNGSTVSAFRAVAVHVWRCTAIATGLVPSDTTKLYTVVDVRNRVDPPLGPEYVGCPIYLTTATATVRELVSNPVEFGSGLIRAAVGKVDDGRVRSLVDHLEGVEDKSGASVLARPMSGSDVYVASWGGMSALEVDFGWGEPELIVRANLKNRMAIVSERKDGGVSVAVALEVEVMEMFKRYFYSWIHSGGLEVFGRE